jgi:hypothetical protein
MHKIKKIINSTVYTYSSYYCSFYVDSKVCSFLPTVDCVYVHRISQASSRASLLQKDNTTTVNT